MSRQATVPFADAVRIWSKIGWLGFGGPAGQIALMHRELVEKHRWISEARFLHALNYCMLLPGPEAQQLATYIGWLMHRVRGGVVAGLLFVLPGFITIYVLSVLYALYGRLPAIAALFFGLKTAVLAIVVQALMRVGKRALKNNFMFAIAAASFAALFLFHVPFPWVIVTAAAIGALASGQVSTPQIADLEQKTHTVGYVVDRLHSDGAGQHVRPSARRAARTTLLCLALWFVPVALATWAFGSAHVLAKEGVFFSQTAVVTFGGAYAVLSYVGQRAVTDLHWLLPGEMVDGLALAETTPGPLIMVLQFVGFMAAYRAPGVVDPWVAATLGALLTTWVTFVPSFMFVLVGAPYVESLRHRRRLNAALAAVTAAVVGVILNLSIWFGFHVLFGEVSRWEWGWLSADVPDPDTLNPGALILTVAALVAVLRFKLALGWTLAGSAVLGVAYLAATGGLR